MTKKMRQLEERSKFEVIKTVNKFIENPENSIKEKENFVEMLNKNYSFTGSSPFELLGKKNDNGYFDILCINSFNLKKIPIMNKNCIMFDFFVDENGHKQNVALAFEEFEYSVKIFLEKYESEYE